MKELIEDYIKQGMNISEICQQFPTSERVEVIKIYETLKTIPTLSITTVENAREIMENPVTLEYIESEDAVRDVQLKTFRMYHTLINHMDNKISEGFMPDFKEQKLLAMLHKMAHDNTPIKDYFNL